MLTVAGKCEMKSNAVPSKLDIYFRYSQRDKSTRLYSTKVAQMQFAHNRIANVLQALLNSWHIYHTFRNGFLLL